MCEWPSLTVVARGLACAFVAIGSSYSVDAGAVQLDGGVSMPDAVGLSFDVFFFFFFFFFDTSTPPFCRHTDAQSQVDFNAPDLERFPNFANARGVEAVVEVCLIMLAWRAFLPPVWRHSPLFSLCGAEQT